MKNAWMIYFSFKYMIYIDITIKKSYIHNVF